MNFILPIVIVASLLGSASSARAQEEWTLQETLRIGAIEGPNALTTVRGMVLIAIGDRTLLATGQPQELTVKLFDAESGEFVGTLGRAGGGPGEMRALTSLSVRGDSIAIADRSQQRIVIFSARSAEHVATERLLADPLEETGGLAAPRAITPDGGYWGSAMLPGIRVANGDVTTAPIVLMDHQGRIRARVAMTSVAGSISFAQLPGAVVTFVQPLVKLNSYSVAPDGSALVIVQSAGAEGRIRVRRFDYLGNQSLDRILDIPPVPVTDAVRDSVYNEFANYLASRGRRVVAAARRAAPEHVTIPEHHPPAYEVLVDGSGGAWLKTAPPDPGGDWRWLVLDERGHPTAYVSVPRSVDIRLLDGNAAWGVTTDQFDIPYVVKYQLVSGSTRTIPSAPAR